MENAEQLCEQGLRHKNGGQLDLAEACYRRALAINARHPQALGNLGITLRLLGRSAEAVDCFAQLAALFPTLPAAHYSLGNALADLGRHEEAADAYRRTIKLNPANADAHINLGLALLATDRTEQAIAAFRQALRHSPNHPLAHRNLAGALASSEQIEPAIGACRQAIALAPGDADAHAQLACLVQDIGGIESALPVFRQALALQPDNPVHSDNYLMALTYAGVAAEAWFEAHRDYGRRLEAHAPLAHDNLPQPDRKLRIGYVSGDLRQHAVANFIWPVLKHYDRERFEVHCYYTGGREDAGSERIRSVADHWHNCTALGTPALAERIRADRMDILVDLSSHSGHNRLPVFALKPAPVQVTWLGYAATTGLSRIDYRITDGYLDPVGQTERWHTENLIRLPRYSLCFDPSPASPEPGPAPARRKGHVTFGSFSNSAKLTSRVVALWAKILTALPEARLLIYVRGSQQPPIRQQVHALFAQHGIAPERIEPFGRLSFGEYLALHNEVDVALDMLTFSGVTTTFYTLWMGVPVVTLPGELPITRGTAAIEHSLGMDEFIAASEADYVSTAITAASDLDKLDALRAGLRARMRASSLLDARAFTRDLEQAYRQIWQRWCANGAENEAPQG